MEITDMQMPILQGRLSYKSNESGKVSCRRCYLKWALRSSDLRRKADNSRRPGTGHCKIVLENKK